MLVVVAEVPIICQFSSAVIVTFTPAGTVTGAESLDVLLYLHRAARVDGFLKARAAGAYSVAHIVADGDVQIHDVLRP